VLAAVETSGMNPHVTPQALLEAQAARACEGLGQASAVTALWFYGSGISGPPQVAQLTAILQACWPDAQVFVDNDLKAALRAAGHAEGIVCILGTGSNACWYAHDQVVARQGGHGYILGDEGGGSDLGKTLLKALLEDRLPRRYMLELEAVTGKTLLDLRTDVYRAPRPQAVLAALAPHLAAWQHDPEVRALIQARFDLFLQTTVRAWPDARRLPLEVVGSVGFHFYEIFKYSCNLAGLEPAPPIAHPIDRLPAFHARQANAG
jgi:N-acetylglucosamine kinase-like BadF-type ATPase